MKQTVWYANMRPMADIVSKEKRSQMMAGIKGKDTKPEIAIRKALFKKGYRYRLHRKDLPGKPDIVLPKYRAIIFVHGCFWHVHDCYLFKWPSTRQEFWKEKLDRNKDRDQQHLTLLVEKGWKILVIWECAWKGKYKRSLEEIVTLTEQFLKSNRTLMEITNTSLCQDYHNTSRA